MEMEESEREMSRVMINNFVIIKTLPWIVLLAWSIFTVRARARSLAVSEVDVFALAVHAWMVLQLVILNSCSPSLLHFIYISSLAKAIYIKFGWLHLPYSSFTCAFLFGFFFGRVVRYVWSTACTNTISDKAALCGVFASALHWLALGMFPVKPFLVVQNMKHMWVVSDSTDSTSNGDRALQSICLSLSRFSFFLSFCTRSAVAMHRWI